MIEQNRGNVQRLIMNVPEVADFLRISESMVRRLVKEKRIPYFKIQARFLFYRLAIEKWADNLTIEAEKGSSKDDASQTADKIWTSKEAK